MKVKVNAEKTALYLAEQVDAMTAPQNMDKKTALEVLDLLADQIQVRIECLKDEIAEDES